MHLTLHLTRGCNLRCSYCYSPPKTDRPMTPEVAWQCLEFGAGLNGDGSCGIILFGGEPLLHKKLIEGIVADGKTMEEQGQGRFHFKMTTNGLLLDEKFIEFALENDLLIAMSLDGTREANDRHRHLPDGAGSFDRLLPKLRLLLAARPYASVLMVVNPDTVDQFAESVCFLLDEGCRYLVISLNFAADWTESDLERLHDQYERLADLYIKWTRAGRKFYLSPFEVKLASHIKGSDYCHDRCELGQRQVSVDPQGHLYPCVQFTAAGPESRWCIGHVATGLDETRRQELYEESSRDKEPCSQCAIRNRCNNTCGCLNWQTTGTITKVSPVLCRHEQMLVPIADRVGETLYAERNELFLHKHYNTAYPILSFLEDSLDPD